MVNKESKIGSDAIERLRIDLRIRKSHMYVLLDFLHGFSGHSGNALWCTKKLLYSYQTPIARISADQKTVTYDVFGKSVSRTISMHIGELCRLAGYFGFELVEIDSSKGGSLNDKEE